jgi:hypothetical protein
VGAARDVGLQRMHGPERRLGEVGQPVLERARGKSGAGAGAGVCTLFLRRLQRSHRRRGRRMC